MSQQVVSGVYWLPEKQVLPLQLLFCFRRQEPTTPFASNHPSLRKQLTRNQLAAYQDLPSATLNYRQGCLHETWNDQRCLENVAASRPESEIDYLDPLLRASG